MTETALTSFTGAAMRCYGFAAHVGWLFRRALKASGTRRALAALPDDILKDVGVSRSEIDFVAGSLASERCDETRDPRGYLNRSIAHLAAARCRASRLVPQAALRIGMALIAATATILAVPQTSFAQNAQAKRGEYLVTFGGCNDCHTPGYFFGKPDTARFLGGSEVGFEIPGLGTFHGPNLTPDRETGIGNWSTDQIATAITTGKRPDGRILAPIMPWHAFANLTGSDVYAIAVYLKSLPPVKNKVPGPFGPGETPTSFVMKIVPPQPATDGAAK